MIIEKLNHVMFIKQKNTLPCRPHKTKISIHSLLFRPRPSSPTHVISAPPQLAEFRFGPAQLGFKVQDFVLGCSFLGDSVLLGLFHLPRRNRGGGAYLTG